MATSSSTDRSRRRLDWPGLLRSLGCQYTTEGKNSKAGCLNIKCPICAYADPSEHLVIDPKTNRWFCWRNKTHRGRDPGRLVQILGHLTESQANEFIDRVTEGEQLGSELSIKEMSYRLHHKEKPKPIIDEALTLPAEAKELYGGAIFSKPSAMKFFNHLQTKRRFGKHAMDACKRFDLHSCTSGEFRNRLLIPFRKEKVLVGWTGRSVLPKAFVRYKNHPPGAVTKRLIFNADLATGGKILFIHEGPMDGMKVDLFASKFDCNAVATLGTNTTAAQIAILHTLIRRYKAAVIGFDPKAESQALRLKSELLAAGKPIRIASMPDGVEDPGAMFPKQAIRFVKHWLKKI